MGTRRDIEVAETLGGISESIKNIEMILAALPEMDTRVKTLELASERQKAYYATAVFIGGLVVGAVDIIIRWYTSWKGH